MEHDQFLIVWIWGKIYLIFLQNLNLLFDNFKFLN